MPEIKVQHIISVSSEDKHFPAENLLQNDAFKKWKCVAGEKQAVIVFQFDKAYEINQIDVGNESSAFIEILVGKSSSKEDDYQVIIVASAFMNPNESRASQNPNRVRIFGIDQLSKAVAGQKWDRAKVICTQPFNKSIPYGLSFIKFHSTPEKRAESESKPVAFGAFKLKSDTDSSQIRMGSLFEKTKLKTETTPVTTPLTGAAAIRAASKLIDQPKSLPPSTVARAASPGPSNAAKSSVDTSKPAAAARTTVTSGHSADGPPPTKRPKAETVESKPVVESKSTSASKAPVETRKPSKPFNKIMNRVVFVLSGFQNPERGDLRDAALEMGAKYRPDWNKGCTHLVCAFENTPKYAQVCGEGRIVKKSWITDCYDKKKLLPWRQYRLGRAPSPTGTKSGSEDEEEQDSVTRTSTAKDNNAAKPAAHVSGDKSSNGGPPDKKTAGTSKNLVDDEALETAGRVKVPAVASEVSTGAGKSVDTSEKLSDPSDKVSSAKTEVPATEQPDSKKSNAEIVADAKKSDDEWDPFDEDIGIESDCDTEEEIRRFEEMQAKKLATPPKSSQSVAPAAVTPGSKSTNEKTPTGTPESKSSNQNTPTGTPGSKSTNQNTPTGTPGSKSTNHNTSASSATRAAPVDVKPSTSDAPSLTQQELDDVYNIPTDDEDFDMDQDGIDNDGLPVLPDFFMGKIFFLQGKHADRRTLVRFIVAYNGQVVESLGKTVKYVVTEDNWNNTFDQALSVNSELVFVRPSWLHACHEAQKCLPFQKYLVTAP